MHFATEREMRIMNGTGFYVHKRIISAVKRVEFVSDRMPYMILKGRWCHVIVLNIHASTEDKIDYVKDSFYDKLEHVFGEYLKYYMKILLDFHAKVYREDIFNRQFGMKAYTKLIMIMELD
jgi:hypothetical protein